MLHGPNTTFYVYIREKYKSITKILSSYRPFYRFRYGVRDLGPLDNGTYLSLERVR